MIEPSCVEDTKPEDIVDIEDFYNSIRGLVFFSTPKFKGTKPLSETQIFLILMV